MLLNKFSTVFYFLLFYLEILKDAAMATFGITELKSVKVSIQIYFLQIHINFIGLFTWNWWKLNIGTSWLWKSMRLWVHFKANDNYNSFIIELKHFSVNLHELWDEFISNSNVEWWYCIFRQRVQYRQPHRSLVQYATGYIRCF